MVSHEWVQLVANSKHCWEGISRVLQMVGNVIKVSTCAIKCYSSCERLANPLGQHSKALKVL